MERYDLDTETWTVLPDLPSLRRGVTMVSAGTRIVAVGGLDTSQTPVDTVDVYNIDTGEWTMGSPLPEPLVGCSAVAWGLYLFFLPT